MILDFHAAHMSEFVANDPDEAIALFHAALEAQAQRAVAEERERCAKEIEAASDDECSHVFFWEAANFLRGR